MGSFNGGTLNVAGNVTVNDTSYSGSSAIRLDGTGAQIVTGVSGYQLLNLQIDKASGTTTLDDMMVIGGNLLVTRAPSMPRH